MLLQGNLLNLWGYLCCRRQERLSPETHQPASPVQSGRRDKDHKTSHYKSQQDSMSSLEKSPIWSVSPQAKSRTSSEDRR